MRPCFSFTSTWLMLLIWYSIGFSMVTTLMSGERISRMSAYRVVVLPLPVGPVTRIIPSGRLMALRTCSSSAGEKPICESGLMPRAASRMRMVIFSPCCVGKLETRRSMRRSL